MAWPRGGPAEGLLGKADGVLQVEPANVGPPGQVQVEFTRTGPPQPQHLGRTGPGGDPLDLDAEDGAAHDRPRPAGAVAGVALLVGMQLAPGLHGHGAVLVVLTDQGGGRGRPGGRVGAVELGPVAAWPARAAGWPWWRVGVDAAVRPQPDQHRCGRLGQVEGELGGVVAAVDDNSGTAWLAGSRASSARIWPAAVWSVSSKGCRRRASTGAVQESRSKLTCAIHRKAQPAMIGWPAEWREGW